MTEEKLAEVSGLCSYLTALIEASKNGVKVYAEIRRVIGRLEDLTK